MNKRRVRDTVLLSGWLFADLLLALAVIFLANTAGIPLRPIPTPTPTPSPTSTQSPTPSPTPTQPPRLELQYHTFFLTINDPTTFPTSSAQDNDIKNQVRQQTILQGRSVGIVVAYGGAPGDGDILQARAIARKVYSVLQSLGQDGFSFQRASYYDPLYLFQGDPGTVRVDVYLFAQ